MRTCSSVKQANDLNFFTVQTTSPLRSLTSCQVFHGISRAEGPSQQARRPTLQRTLAIFRRQPVDQFLHFFYRPDHVLKFHAVRDPGGLLKTLAHLLPAPF